LGLREAWPRPREWAGGARRGGFGWAPAACWAGAGKEKEGEERECWAWPRREGREERRE